MIFMYARICMICDSYIMCTGYSYSSWLQSWMSRGSCAPIPAFSLTAHPYTQILESDCRRRPGAAGHEDGTAHFLAIAALRHGFAALERAGGLPAIELHTAAITRCENGERCHGVLYVEWVVPMSSPCIRRQE